MKVKEYLVKRIEVLESDLELTRVSHAEIKCSNTQLIKRIDALTEQVDQLTTEREHIKQIITCNIGYDAGYHLELNIRGCDNDFKTLRDIFDIKPDDYELHICQTCKHRGDITDDSPCIDCTDGEDKWEVIPDAETKD